MEAYSPARVPIIVGGMVGRIFWPGDGRFVGGCAGAVRRGNAERQRLGGCVGKAGQLADRRFVGGCAGLVWLHRPGSHLGNQPDLATRSERRAAWDDEVSAEAAA